tara:strand:+ start:298 stop:483 length:186 start_codon:yes stop_codon:yes gene_type:complete
MDNGENAAYPIHMKYKGLTKREYFAIKMYCSIKAEDIFSRDQTAEEWAIDRTDKLLKALDK